jgi:eukaryotic-like serine/threonine-protein kinase
MNRVATVESVDDLAEDFARRYRTGEKPLIQEYVDRYPEWADEIRDILPAVQMMEDLKPRSDEAAQKLPLVSPIPANMPERIGEYRLLREIGRGGMGVVYEALQESLGRHVALKILPGHLLTKEKLRQRFRRESEAAAKLHHTNIVSVFSIGEEQGYSYYVMQLIEGQSLDQWIQATEGGATPERPDSTVEWKVDPASEDGFPSSPISQVTNHSSLQTRTPTSPTWIARIGTQVADALDYTHRQGVIHRDIKPANLLLDPAGTVWITDFGVAKLIEGSNLTESGDLVGTLRYMPPERFSGNSDHRGDIYSLGITLYELAIRKPVFPDTGPHQLIERITRKELPRLRSIDRNIPIDLETIILKACARDPGHRYATAQLMADDLRRFLDDRPIRARRVSLFEQSWRWCRRNPAVTSLTALALGLMILVTMISVLAYLQTSAANREVSKANLEIGKALDAEQMQRENAENTAALSLEALNRMYERFAPNRLVATPSNTVETSDGTTAELPPAPTLPPEMIPLLEDLLQTYERIARASGEFPKLQKQAAEARQHIGDIQIRLGRHEQAVQAYRSAIEILEKTNETADEDRLIRLVRSYNECGKAYRALQNFDAARNVHEQAIRILKDAPESIRNRPEFRYELARTYSAFNPRDNQMPFFGGGGPPNMAQGRERIDRNNRRDDRKGPDGPPGLPRGEKDEPRFGPNLVRKGNEDSRFNPSPQRRPGEENPTSSLAIPILEQLVKEYPGVPEYRHLLACCYRDFSNGPINNQQERAIELLRQLVSDFPKVPDYRYDLAETLGRGGFMGRMFSDNSPKMMTKLDEAIKLSDQLMKEYPTVPQYAATAAQLFDRQGMHLQQQRKPAEAEPKHRRAYTIQSNLVKQYPDVDAYRIWLIMIESGLSRDLMEQQQWPEARKILADAVNQMEVIQRKSESPFTSPLLGRIYSEYAQVLVEMNERDEAEAVRKKLDGLRFFRGPGPGKKE